MRLGVKRRRRISPAGLLGKVDPEFSFAVFKQRGGKLAVLGIYAAHATVLSSDMP